MRIALMMRMIKFMYLQSKIGMKKLPVNTAAPPRTFNGYPITFDSSLIYPHHSFTIFFYFQDCLAITSLRAQV